MSVDKKIEIESVVKSFSNDDLFEDGIKLFQSLGYKTERQNRLLNNSYDGFIDSFPNASEKMNKNKTYSKEWRTVELLFQLTQSEMSRQSFLFDKGKVDNTIIEAYLFFAIGLAGNDYTRTKLSEITRELNKVFLMPVMVLFKYDNKLTLSVIKRRIHKKDESKDVLEKVTLIKDIDIINPHPAHIHILYDLSFEKLQSDFEFRNFVELHNAWQKTLDSSELNKRFYKELANWYFWAVDNVEFPDDAERDKEKRNSINAIRLLTRLIFVWFLKEKDNLIPAELFNKKKLDRILDYKDKTGSTYYKAILQNLFFATLNTEMDKDIDNEDKIARTFVKRQYGIQEFYRYERFFKDKDVALRLFENIPFLNGGLFENLDQNIGEQNEVRIDCFSNKRENESRLKVPDFLFFSEELEYNELNKVYDTTGKKYVVRGLINLLNSYKFTIHENTPIEEEIALDPELLGKVFENLLASYNEETKTTARKLTGSFYTPREVVDYMVEDSLIQYLLQKLQAKNFGDESKLRKLCAYTEEDPGFSEEEKDVLVEAIDHCKILDPACGSGAFAMGILHKMVFVLGKLDPKNERWKQRQIDRIYDLPDRTLHEHLKEEIEKSFRDNYDDFGRKLYLIENCVYGVDIQPIAVQISKLRFFISLIVDQKVNRNTKNFGVRPLPNLETKIVAADTLRGIEKRGQMSLRNPAIDEKEEELRRVRERHFSARTPAAKKKYRELDKALRDDLARLLEKDGFNPSETRLMASWDPYDQSTSAGFFDAEWMFGLKKGFNIVIGNPPYGLVFDLARKRLYEEQFHSFKRNNDIYVAFFERSLSLLEKNAILVFITPNTYLNGDYFKTLRHYFRKTFYMLEIVDFKNSRIFHDPTVYVCITTIKNSIPPLTPYKSIIKISNVDFTETMNNIIVIENIGDDSFKPENPIIDQLFTKFGKDKIFELGKSFYVKDVGFNYWTIGKGKKRDGDSIGDRIFYSGVKKDVNDKAFIKGKDIEKYLIHKPSNYLRHNYADYLKKNIDVFRYSSNYLEVSPKITYRQTSNRIIAAIDTNKYLCDKTVHIIVPKDEMGSIWYLVALLNSKLFVYFYNYISQELEGRAFAQVKTTYIKRLPLIELEEANKKALGKVALMISILKNYKREEANTFEKLVDAMVYELYFPDAIKVANAEVLELLKIQLFDVQDLELDQKSIGTINTIYNVLNDPNGEIRNRILKQNISVDEVRLINQNIRNDATP